MPKRQIDARELIADIRVGMSDAALMKKYAVSAKELQGLFNRLVNAGVVSQRELDQRIQAFVGTVVIADDVLEDIVRAQDRTLRRPRKAEYVAVPAEKTTAPSPSAAKESGKPAISGHEISRLIKDGATDEELMERFRLSARGLESLLRKMVAVGMMAQSELDERTSLREKSVVVDFAPVQKATLKWGFRTSDVVGSPVVENGMVYFGSWDGHLYAADLETGEEKWRFKTDGAVHGRPALAEGLICAGSGDHHLYCLDAATGKERWKFQTGGQVFSSPTIHTGVVYFGSADSHVYAVSLATGSEKWRFPTKGPVFSSPAVADDVVYVGSDDGSLYVLTVAEGFSISAH